MDFYILKEEVVKSLNLTLGVVEKRQTLPILSNVLIEVDETSLKFTATDLESEISTTSTISNFKSGGKTTAPARKLSDLCRLLPDLTEIHFYLDGDNLNIEPHPVNTIYQLYLAKIFLYLKLKIQNQK